MKSQKNKIVKHRLQSFNFILQKLQLSSFIASNLHVNTIISKLKDYANNKFIDGWQNELSSDVGKQYGNKLRTYRNFKNQFKMEEYLHEIRNSEIRNNLTKFRISAHKLNIEKLRYIVPRIKPEDRLCDNCNSKEVENEIHFLLICNKYEQIRNKFITKIKLKYTNIDFDNFDNYTKFIWLMGNVDPYVITLLAEYITTCLKCRHNHT